VLSGGQPSQLPNWLRSQPSRNHTGPSGSVDQAQPQRGHHRLLGLATAQIAAAVSFYGGGIRRARWPGIARGINLAARVSTPWLGFYGDKDTGISVDQVEQLRTALETAAAPAEIGRYPNAAHAFALDPTEQRYAPIDAQDACRRTGDFFATHLLP
jgi:carboxymethylenebutenolidase